MKRETKKSGSIQGKRNIKKPCTNKAVEEYRAYLKFMRERQNPKLKANKSL